MSNDVMLTTVDNPYDPFTEFDKWYQYDSFYGYDTCGLVARLTHTSTQFPEEMQLRDIEAAIDSFLSIDPTGVYKKLVKTG